MRPSSLYRSEPQFNPSDGTGGSHGCEREGSGSWGWEKPEAIRLRRQAGEKAGGLADTLRSVCKDAINNILEAHPLFLHVLT